MRLKPGSHSWNKHKCNHKYKHMDAVPVTPLENKMAIGWILSLRLHLLNASCHLCKHKKKETVSISFTCACDYITLVYTNIFCAYAWGYLTSASQL